MNIFNLKGVSGTFKDYELQPVVEVAESSLPDDEDNQAYKTSRKLKREGVASENILTTRRR